VERRKASTPTRRQLDHALRELAGIVEDICALLDRRPVRAPLNRRAILLPAVDRLWPRSAPAR